MAESSVAPALTHSDLQFLLQRPAGRLFVLVGDVRRGGGCHGQAAVLAAEAVGAPDRAVAQRANLRSIGEDAAQSSVHAIHSVRKEWLPGFGADDSTEPRVKAPEVLGRSSVSL